MCARKFWRYLVLPRAGRRSADGPFGRPGILPYFQITPFFSEALWFKTMRITICKRDGGGGGVLGVSAIAVFFLPRNINMYRQMYSAFPTTHFLRLQLRMWQHSIALLWLLGTESNRTTTRWQLKASEDGSVVTGLYFAARVTFRREGTDYINLLLDPTYEHASSMKSETLQPPTGIWPRTVQTVANRYTDWVMPALYNVLYEGEWQILKTQIRAPKPMFCSKRVGGGA